MPFILYGSEGALHEYAPVVSSYPSGEPLVRFPRGFRPRGMFFRPTSMLDLMAGLFFVDALVDRGFAPPALLLPFVPGARQDRLSAEDASDYLFTAKSVAKEINLRGFPRVTVLDPHSEVAPALIDRCQVVHAHECLEGFEFPIPYAAVVAPDAGAEKRAGAVARQLGVPLLRAWKTRNVETGDITGFGMESGAVGGRVLVVDDICDGGWTFIGLSKVLAERCPAADLYVTHGVFSKGTDELLLHYQRIYSTDSVESIRPGVTTIPVCHRILGRTS